MCGNIYSLRGVLKTVIIDMHKPHDDPHHCVLVCNRFLLPRVASRVTHASQTSTNHTGFVATGSARLIIKLPPVCFAEGLTSHRVSSASDMFRL